MSLGVSRSLGVSGYLWGTLDVFRCLWGTLDVFRCVWVSLGVSGGLWISSGLSGCLQVCPGLSGCLQVSLGDSGCLWGSLMVSGSLFFHSRSCCSIDALSSGAKWPLPFFICRIPLSLFFPSQIVLPSSAPLFSVCGWRLQRRQAAAHKSRLYPPLEEAQCRRSRLGIGAAACQ